MFGYLLLLFTLVPAIELMLLIQVGSHIGSINTILLIVITGILGASLARLQGFYILNKIQTNLNKGVMPNAELMDGLMILIGGIVLLTPGFVTDAFGLFLLIPATRKIIKYLVQKHMSHMIEKGQVVHFQTRSQDHKQYDDIDI